MQEREVQDVRQGESQESRSRLRSPADESRHLRAIPLERLSADFRRSRVELRRLAAARTALQPELLVSTVSSATQSRRTSTYKQSYSPSTDSSAAVNPQVQIPQAFPNSLRGAVLAVVCVPKVRSPLGPANIHADASSLSVVKTD